MIRFAEGNTEVLGTPAGPPSAAAPGRWSLHLETQPPGLLPHPAASVAGQHLRTGFPARSCQGNTKSHLAAPGVHLDFHNCAVSPRVCCPQITHFPSPSLCSLVASSAGSQRAWDF